MIKQIGKTTLMFTDKPRVIGFGSAVGKKEGEGPLKDWFDKIFYDTSMGGKSWETAEGLLQQEALSIAINNSGLSRETVDCVFAGDLLNQCVSSSYGLRDFGIPFLGQYGACSTMAQTIAMSAVFVESGAANACAAVTSSHFCSAERQFRFPLQYGGQRTPTAQWTVTGAGSVITAAYRSGKFLSGNEFIAPSGADEELREKKLISVEHVCFGRIVDMGITDANNMGAAMAGAAADTLYKFLKETGTGVQDYDLIITGDLGQVGTELLYELLNREGMDIKPRHRDCGLMIYDRERQDTHSGGSGCGCSGSVLCSYFMKNMRKRKYNKILFIATGALMSPTIVQQGESIPGIAHLIHFVNTENN